MEAETLLDRFSGEKTEYELTGTYHKKNPVGQMVKMWIVVNTTTNEEIEYTTKDFEGIFKIESHS